MLSDFLISAYPWSKALHIASVLSWMAGLFYLPRLMVYHVEQAVDHPKALPIFRMMEHKLLRYIMYPAMLSTWLFGLLLVFTPGIVDWSFIWPWTKGASVIAMTWFHYWLSVQRTVLETGTGNLTGRRLRLMNELPTLLMLVIVFSVIFKF